MSPYHDPVLFQECLDALQIKPEGVYVDATFGGGGHSRGIFNQLTTGSLLAFDQDRDARQNAQLLDGSGTPGGSGERSFTFIEANFRHLKRYLRLHGISKVDGILADLGVSSHQFDEPERGFTTRADGLLDMRMDRNGEKNARDVINGYKEKDLIHVFSAYGEIKNARTLAGAIVAHRLDKGIDTTDVLRNIAWEKAPRGREWKYVAQVFQAIRIEVNQEMEALKEFLNQAGEVLAEEGRLVVISYHSLEDRLVKNFINKGNMKGIDEKDFYGNPVRILDPVNRKPIVPTPPEIEKNNRARSAKLRIGKKRPV